MQGQGPAEWPQFPFCSDRCRLVDLGRWLGGAYRIPGTPVEEENPARPSDDSDIP
jgi:endogenous inhibitor of DNA gyrase (YacG/DUF329 family)